MAMTPAQRVEAEHKLHMIDRPVYSQYERADLLRHMLAEAFAKGRKAGYEDGLEAVNPYSAVSPSSEGAL